MKEGPPTTHTPGFRRPYQGKAIKHSFNGQFEHAHHFTKPPQPQPKTSLVHAGNTLRSKLAHRLKQHESRPVYDRTLPFRNMQARKTNHSPPFFLPSFLPSFHGTTKHTLFSHARAPARTLARIGPHWPATTGVFSLVRWLARSMATKNKHTRAHTKTRKICRTSNVLRKSRHRTDELLGVLPFGMLALVRINQEYHGVYLPFLSVILHGSFGSPC